MSDINDSEEIISISDQVRQRIMIANNYWEETCLDIQKGRLDKYSRHVIFLLPDLIEELKRNQELFTKNNFGRLFFAKHLSKIINLKDSRKKSCFPSSLEVELKLIIEALEGKKHSFDITSLVGLIEKVYSTLTSQEFYEYFVDGLIEILKNSKKDVNLSKFYFQTVILIIFFRGRSPSRNYFNNIIEESVDIYNFRRDSEDEIRVGDSCFSDDEILDILLEETVKKIKSYFPTEEEDLVVIFQVKNLEMQEVEDFEIGNVHFYNPEKNEGLYINENVEMTTIEKNTQVCAAVKIKGLNNVTLARKAKRDVERASAFLPTRKGKRNPIIIANSFEIFDSQGHQGAWSWNTSQDNIKIYTYWPENSREVRDIFGKWLTLEADKSQNSEAVAYLLRMIDIHRRSVESQQYDREILDSWFAFESLSPALKKCSIRLPIQENDGKNWISATDKIQTKIQGLVIFCALRQFFRNKASSTAQLFYSEIELKLSLNAVIDESTRELFCDGKYINWSNFLVNIDDIQKNVSKYNSESKALSRLQEIKTYFFDINVCKNVVSQKISEISEDIYNIYRLRNMLVHSGYTDSPLLSHYALQSLTYGSSVIQAITAALYQEEKIPSNPLDFYLQNIFIRGNLALEALYSKDNNEGIKRFRNWIMYDF